MTPRITARDYMDPKAGGFIVLLYQCLFFHSTFFFSPDVHCPYIPIYTWSPPQILTELGDQNIKEAFKALDKDSNGYIEKMELLQIMRGLGESLSEVRDRSHIT